MAKPPRQSPGMAAGARPPRRPRATPPARKGPDRYDFQHDSLGYALRRAQVRAYELFFEMLGAMELSPARLTALSLVATEPDLHQATLARRLGIAGPSVLKLVDALESAGYVRRMEVAGDRRRHALAITPAGRGTLEQVRSGLDAYEARLAQGLSAAERTQLLALLARVAT
jgi:DNA-binding MarR family transcriptional regulator